MSYDLLVKNGRIIDGAGNPWYRGDIGVVGDKIATIGRLGEAKTFRVIDAEGMVVTPGFVDAHSHSDMESLIHRELVSTVMMGVTTIVSGMCGMSPAPIDPKQREDIQKEINKGLPLGVKLDVNWTSFDDYLCEEEKTGLGINIAHLVGHGAIRAAAMGYAARDPKPEEMERMRVLTAEAMTTGAYGITTGLIYPPGIFAKTDELIELSKVVTKYGGIYDSHIRGEGENLIASVKEAITIGEEARIPVQISHHKASNKSVWGKSVETLRMIEEARERGVDVTVDQYPYPAGATSLVTLLPPWVHDGGTIKLLERLRNPKQREKIRKDLENGVPGWENFAGDLGWDKIYVSRVNSDKNKSVEGLNLVEIKNLRKESDEFSALWKIIVEEEANAGMIIFSMDEDDIRRIMQSPYQMVGTDSSAAAISGPFSSGKPHPRFYGTYPRILCKYVREEKVIRLEEAIRKMTSFPAQRFGILDRGILRPGMYADITVFSPENICEKSTFKEPHAYPEGIPYVIVNGRVVVDESRFTGILAGRTLRKRT